MFFSVKPFEDELEVPIWDEPFLFLSIQGQIKEALTNLCAETSLWSYSYLYFITVL